MDHEENRIFILGSSKDVRIQNKEAGCSVLMSADLPSLGLPKRNFINLRKTA